MEWEYKIFDDLITNKSNIYNIQKDSNNYKCIELENIKPNLGMLNGYFNSVDQKSSKNYFFKNEILFGKLRPYLKKYWFAKFDGVCSTEFWVLKSKDTQKITNKFLYYIIQSNYFLQLCNLSTGSKMPRADWSYIKEQSIAIPILSEQEKIANTLELLDKKIELQLKKIEALKLYKLSTQKKLLSNKILQPYKTLYFDEVCDIQTGKSNTQDKDDNGIYPFYIRSAEIQKSNKYLFDCEAVLTIGDGNIGKIFFYENGKFDCHQRVYVLNNFRNVIGKYLYYFFELNFYKRALSMSAKNTVDSVRLEMISKMKINIPDITKQYNIIKILDSLNKKYILEISKLNTLKQLKKGLMQNMFV